MFTAPPEQTLEWSDEGVQGAYRFIRKLWNAVYEHCSSGEHVKLDVASLTSAQKDLRRQAHHTLAKVTDDIGRRRVFNTAIAAVMELFNALGRFDDPSPQAHAIRHEAFEIITIALSPIIPHVTHVLWQSLGHEGALIDERWPTPDPAALVQDAIEMVVQVNGKLRSRITVPVSADESYVREMALADEHVKKFVADKPLRKCIVVPGKLVNLVV
jgi:leucyl-tRNA synthetase